MSKLGHFSPTPVFLPIVYVFHKRISLLWVESGKIIENLVFSFPSIPTKLFPCSFPFPWN